MRRWGLKEGDKSGRRTARRVDPLPRSSCPCLAPVIFPTADGRRICWSGLCQGGRPGGRTGQAALSSARTEAPTRAGDGGTCDGEWQPARTCLRPR